MDFEKLAEMLKTDPDAREKLIRYYLPKVTDIARLYENQGVGRDDLIGEGSLALVECIHGFASGDTGADAEALEGELFRSIMNAMEQAVNVNLSEADKGERIAEKVNLVADKARELSSDYGRKVTVFELMEESGLTEKVIRDAIRLSASNIEDIDYSL